MEASILNAGESLPAKESQKGIKVTARLPDRSRDALHAETQAEPEQTEVAAQIFKVNQEQAICSNHGLR